VGADKDLEVLGGVAAGELDEELCDREGLVEAAGRRMAAGARGRPVALLGLVFVAGSAITAVLSLDAAVVLLTPVMFATAVRLQLRPKPHVYACTHLANSASLLCQCRIGPTCQPSRPAACPSLASRP
jgi:arsenical pump membrane protein